jgi:hypothetical protein
LAVKRYFSREGFLEENTKTMYSLIWGQCSEAMRARLQSTQLYGSIKMSFNVVELLKTIKDVIFSYQDQKYGPQALGEAKRRFSLIIQDKHMTCQMYLDKFTNAVQVITHCGGDIGMDKGLVNTTLASAVPAIGRSTATSGEIRAAEEYSHQQYLACLFLLGSDRGRYGVLVQDLENNFTQKVDKWPKTLVDAYSLLMNWKRYSSNTTRTTGTGSDGVAFANVEEEEEEEEYGEAHANSEERESGGRGGPGRGGFG